MGRFFPSEGKGFELVMKSEDMVGELMGILQSVDHTKSKEGKCADGYFFLKSLKDFSR